MAPPFNPADLREAFQEAIDRFNNSSYGNRPNPYDAFGELLDPYVEMGEVDAPTPNNNPQPKSRAAFVPETEPGRFAASVLGTPDWMASSRENRHPRINHRVRSVSGFV